MVAAICEDGGCALNCLKKMYVQSQQYPQHVQNVVFKFEKEGILRCSNAKFDAFTTKHHYFNNRLHDY